MNDTTITVFNKNLPETKGNILARTAAMAFCEDHPLTPLWLYGGSDETRAAIITSVHTTFILNCKHAVVLTAQLMQDLIIMAIKSKGTFHALDDIIRAADAIIITELDSLANMFVLDELASIISVATNDGTRVMLVSETLDGLETLRYCLRSLENSAIFDIQ